MPGAVAIEEGAVLPAMLSLLRRGDEGKRRWRRPVMSHVVLLGDSILDNAAYTRGGPDVATQVRDRLPPDWKTSLLAVDGSTTAQVASQIARLPADATHLVLSVGGNDALSELDILETRVTSVRESMMVFADVAAAFEARYRAAIARCLAPGLAVAACTIYHGWFEDRAFQRVASTALAVFNDAIIRIAAVQHGVSVIDLRTVCNSAADYANPIEPSSIGGAKIATVIVRWVTEGDAIRGASRIVIA
jgi:lysophospholipase L1-like esterase